MMQEVTPIKGSKNMVSSMGSSGKPVHKNKFRCEFCPATFPYKNFLRKHLACMHLDPFFYKCSRCNYFNQSWPSTQTHLQTEHGGDRDVNIIKNNIHCELCSLHFPSRSELERHVILRHSAELQCPACEEDKHFVTKESLKSHFISKHGESLWGSYLCTTYKEAYHRVHKLKVDPHSKEYCCYICNRDSYAARMTLFRHVIAHFGLYPYCCPECPYMSEVRSYVRNHCARYHPKSNSMYKIVNRFARWDQKLRIKRWKKYWQQDTVTQHKSSFEEKKLSMLYNARREKEVSVLSNPKKTTISVEPFEVNISKNRGEQCGENPSSEESCFVCNLCGCSFPCYPQFHQHISNRPMCNKKSTLMQSEISQPDTVQNLAHTETSRGKRSELDVKELQDPEHQSMEFEISDVIPEKNTSKDAELDKHPREEPHVTKDGCLCCLCDLHFTSYIEFYTHALKHENQAVYRCSTCSHTYISLIQIRRHVKLRHKTQAGPSIQLVPVNLSRKTCDDLTSTKKELQTRNSLAHDVRLHCPLCQELFESIPLLRKHFELEHSTESWVSHAPTVGEELEEIVRNLNPDPLNQFTCFYCGHAFDDRGGLLAHLRCVHLKCSSGELGSSFQQETGCRDGKRKNFEGRIACYICKSRFIAKTGLIKHLRKHSASNISLPYFCKSCGAFCAHRNSMEVHWYENHGKSKVRFTRISKLVSFRAISLSNFPCRYCNSYRSTETDRQRHESEQHADNYKCSGCNFACEKIGMMKIHITVVHAKSDPKPSMLRRKLCPVSTINKEAGKQMASQSSAQDSPSLLANNHTGSGSIKMEPDDSKLLNFEFVECEPASKKPMTKKNSLKEPQSNCGFGLNVAATSVRKNHNVSLRESPGFNSQLTGSKSPARAQGETGRICPSNETSPCPAKSSTASSSKAQTNGNKSSSRWVVENSTSPPPLAVELDMDHSIAFNTPVQGSISHPQIVKIIKQVLSSPMAGTESVEPKVKKERTSTITLASQTKIPASSFASVIHSEGDWSSLVPSDLEFGIGNPCNQTKTVPVSSTHAATLKYEDMDSTTNQFIKGEMEFEDTVIKEEPMDNEDSMSTEDYITYPKTPFQFQALPYLTEVKPVKTEDLDLREEHAQCEVLSKNTDLSDVEAQEPILHHQR